MSKTKFFFSFEKIALVVGFIVDIFTIITILISNKVRTTPIDIRTLSPVLAFFIWLLALYIYLSFTYKYWDENYSILTNGLRISFAMFLFCDILLSFQHPILLFLFLSLHLSFALIIFSWSAAFFAAVLVLFPMVYVPFLSYMLSAYRTEKQKIKIDREWVDLEERVNTQLIANQWLSIGYLLDIKQVKVFNNDALAYILAKFAATHPERTLYGHLYDSYNNHVNQGDPVLINLELIDAEKYHL